MSWNDLYRSGFFSQRDDPEDEYESPLERWARTGEFYDKLTPSQRLQKRLADRGNVLPTSAITTDNSGDRLTREAEDFLYGEGSSQGRLAELAYGAQGSLGAATNTLLQAPVATGMDLMGFDDAAKRMRDRMREQNEAMRSVADTPERVQRGGIFSQLKEDARNLDLGAAIGDVARFGINTTAEMLPSIGAAAATGGGTGVASALMALSQATESYGDYRDEGTGKLGSLGIAAPLGAATYALEKFGLDETLGPGGLRKFIPGTAQYRAAKEAAEKAAKDAAGKSAEELAKKSGFKGVLHSINAEGSTEALQENVQYGANLLGGSEEAEDFSLAKLAERNAEAYFGGGLMGAGFYGLNKTLGPKANVVKAPGSPTATPTTPGPGGAAKALVPVLEEDADLPGDPDAPPPPTPTTPPGQPPSLNDRLAIWKYQREHNPKRFADTLSTYENLLEQTRTMLGATQDPAAPPISPISAFTSALTGATSVLQQRMAEATQNLGTAAANPSLVKRLQSQLDHYDKIAKEVRKSYMAGVDIETSIEMARAKQVDVWRKTATTWVEAMPPVTEAGVAPIADPKVDGLLDMVDNLAPKPLVAEESEEESPVVALAPPVAPQPVAPPAPLPQPPAPSLAAPPPPEGTPFPAAPESTPPPTAPLAPPVPAPVAEELRSESLNNTLNFAVQPTPAPVMPAPPALVPTIPGGEALSPKQRKYALPDYLANLMPWKKGERPKGFAVNRLLTTDEMVEQIRAFSALGRRVQFTQDQKSGRTIYWVTEDMRPLEARNGDKELSYPEIPPEEMMQLLPQPEPEPVAPTQLMNRSIDAGNAGGAIPFPSLNQANDGTSGASLKEIFLRWDEELQDLLDDPPFALGALDELKEVKNRLSADLASFPKDVNEWLVSKFEAVVEATKRQANEDRRAVNKSRFSVVKDQPPESRPFPDAVNERLGAPAPPPDAMEAWHQAMTAPTPEPSPVVAPEAPAPAGGDDKRWNAVAYEAAVMASASSPRGLPVDAMSRRGIALGGWATDKIGTLGDKQEASHRASVELEEFLTANPKMLFAPGLAEGKAAPAPPRALLDQVPKGLKREFTASWRDSWRILYERTIYGHVNVLASNYNPVVSPVELTKETEIAPRIKRPRKSSAAKTSAEVVQEVVAEEVAAAQAEVAAQVVAEVRDAEASRVAKSIMEEADGDAEADDAELMTDIEKKQAERRAELRKGIRRRERLIDEGTLIPTPEILDKLDKDIAKLRAMENVANVEKEASRRSEMLKEARAIRRMLDEAEVEGLTPERDADGDVIGADDELVAPGVVVKEDEADIFLRKQEEAEKQAALPQPKKKSIPRPKPQHVAIRPERAAQLAEMGVSAVGGYVTEIRAQIDANPDKPINLDPVAAMEKRMPNGLAKPAQEIYRKAFRAEWSRQTAQNGDEIAGFKPLKEAEAAEEQGRVRTRLDGDDDVLAFIAAFEQKAKSGAGPVSRRAQVQLEESSTEVEDTAGMGEDDVIVIDESDLLTNRFSHANSAVSPEAINRPDVYSFITINGAHHHIPRVDQIDAQPGRGQIKVQFNPLEPAPRTVRIAASNLPGNVTLAQLQRMERLRMDPFPLDDEGVRIRRRSANVHAAIDGGGATPMVDRGPFGKPVPMTFDDLLGHVNSMTRGDRESVRAVSTYVTALARLGGYKSENEMLANDLSIIDEGDLKVPGRRAEAHIVNGRALIRLFQGSNVNTILHELSHFALDHLPKDQLQTVLDYVGAKDLDSMTVEQEEFWAHTAEWYFKQGHLPAKGIKGALVRLKEFAVDMYRAATGQGPVRKMDPKIRQLMDSIITEGTLRQYRQAKLTLRGTKAEPAEAYFAAKAAAGEGRVRAQSTTLPAGTLPIDPYIKRSKDFAGDGRSLVQKLNDGIKQSYLEIVNKDEHSEKLAMKVDPTGVLRGLIIANRAVSNSARYVIERGTRMFDWATGQFVRTGDGLATLLNGLSEVEVSDLNAYWVAERRIELFEQHFLDKSKYEQAMLTWKAHDKLRREALKNNGIASNGQSITQIEAAAKLAGVEKRPKIGDFRRANWKLDPKSKALQASYDTRTALQTKWGVDGTAAYEKRLKDIRDWLRRATLDRLVEVGRIGVVRDPKDPSRIIGGEYLEILNSGQKYAPLMRLVQDPATGEWNISRRSGKNSDVIGGDPMKELDDPESPAMSSMEAAIMNAQRLQIWADRQLVINRMVKTLAEQYPDSGEVSEVHPFTKGPKSPGKNLNLNKKVTVWEDGKQKQYFVNNDLLRTFDNAPVHQSSLFLSALSGMARSASEIKRAGATLTPQFALKNWFRDQISAGVNSRFNYIPFVSLFKYVIDAHVGSEKLGSQFNQLMDEYLINSVALGSNASMDLQGAEITLMDLLKGRSSTERGFGGAFKQVRKEWADARLEWGNSKFEAVKDWILAPLRVVSGRAEEATRIALFMNARKAQLKDGGGKTQAGDIARALEESRSGTLDFSRSGSVGKVWNTYDAFLNATIQDFDKTVRNFRERPASTLIKTMFYVMAPAALNFGANYDDEEYWNLPEWDRMLFFHYKRDGGGYIRIPRPIGIVNAVFGYGLEKVLATAYQKTDTRDAVKNFLNGLTESSPLEKMPLRFSTNPGQALELNPSALPDILEPAAEIWANKDSFRNKPIDPQGFSQLDPTLAGSADTGIVEQKLSEATGGTLSPNKVRHAIGGYTASLGRMAVDGINAFYSGDWEEKPFLEKMGLASRRPIGFSSEPVHRFYKHLNEAVTGKNSVEYARQQRSPNKVKEMENRYPSYRWTKQLNETNQALRDLRDQINRAKSDPNLSKIERAEKIAGLEERVTQVAGARILWLETMMDPKKRARAGSE